MEGEKEWVKDNLLHILSFIIIISIFYPIRM